jgi:hypothetical protein
MEPIAKHWIETVFIISRLGFLSMVAAIIVSLYDRRVLAFRLYAPGAVAFLVGTLFIAVARCTVENLLPAILVSVVSVCGTGIGFIFLKWRRERVA